MDNERDKVRDKLEGGLDTIVEALAARISQGFDGRHASLERATVVSLLGDLGYDSEGIALPRVCSQCREPEGAGQTIKDLTNLCDAALNLLPLPDSAWPDAPNGHHDRHWWNDAMVRLGKKRDDMTERLDRLKARGRGDKS